MAKSNSIHLNLQDSELTQANFSYPLSIPSQPPDIKNWFSSYEYESPESSDIPHGIDSLELPANSDSEMQCPFEISRIQNGVDSPAAKNNVNSSDKRSWDESFLRAGCIQLNDDQNPLQEIGGKPDDDIEHNSRIANVNSVVDHGELLEKPLAGLKREHKTRQVNNAEEENDDDLNTSGKHAKSKAEDDTLQNKQVFLNSADGFISTRKREIGRSIPSNSISMNHDNQAATNGSKEKRTRERLMREDVKENNGILARRELVQEGRANALADRTNIHVERGIPGKWQCPRKRKPYVGPPLKQLRLEQWVRRVN